MIGLANVDLDHHAQASSLTSADKASHAMVEEAGVFGAPFLVDENEKYWGHPQFDLWQEEGDQLSSRANRRSK